MFTSKCQSKIDADHPMDWIDNADSYLCPVCRMEVSTPTKYNYHCPRCGFVADRDERKILKENLNG